MTGTDLLLAAAGLALGLAAGYLVTVLFGDPDPQEVLWG